MIEGFGQLVGNPYFWGLAFLYWAFNAIVEGMPEPTDKNGVAYHWAYKSLNTFSGNVRAAFQTKIPGAKP